MPSSVRVRTRTSGILRDGVNSGNSQRSITTCGRAVGYVDLMHAAHPRDQLTRLMDGYLSTQMLYVSVRLGLFDLLLDGPRTSAQLAAAVGAAASPLHRLLRGLVLEGLLSEEPDGGYAATAAGRLLSAGVPGSLRGAVLARGAVYYRAAAGLLDMIRDDGGTAFRHAYGVELFDHLAASPEDAEIFQLSMLARSHQEAAALVATYDFAPFNHVIDIGGGYGVTLTAILTACPGVRGTLFDRPEITATARRRLAAAHLTDRATVVGGDFFDGVPDGGDVYVLSRVLHDWDDDAAVRILKSCRRALRMPVSGRSGSRLIIVEAILGDRVHDAPAAVRMDLHMLTLATGRERTAAEFATVLRAAGFRIDRILTPAPGQTPGVHILEATPDM
jgi:O-methyltransferase domain/Dimerisation domain